MNRWYNPFILLLHQYELFLNPIPNSPESPTILGNRCSHFYTPSGTDGLWPSSVCVLSPSVWPSREYWRWRECIHSQWPSVAWWILWREGIVVVLCNQKQRKLHHVANQLYIHHIYTWPVRISYHIFPTLFSAMHSQTFLSPSPFLPPSLPSPPLSPPLSQ